MGDSIDLLKIILNSGPILQGVLLILVFSSIYSWSVVLKKRKYLKLVLASNSEFMDFYSKTTNLNEILAKSREYAHSSHATLFIKGYEELLRINDKVGGKNNITSLQGHFTSFGFQSLERALQQGVNEINEKLDALLAHLASIGSISPFIGLFGTVWGIIHSFRGLSSGNNSLDVVAPGIAEALVATAIGLAAAIPAVAFFNYFSGENGRLNNQMESFGQNFLNMIERSLVSKVN